MTYITDQLVLTKVYILPYSPHFNSVVDRCHSFPKNAIRKMRCNYETDRNQLAQIAMIAYNIFSHTATVYFSLCMHEMHIYQLCTICCNQKCTICIVMSVKYTWI